MISASALCSSSLVEESSSVMDLHFVIEVSARQWNNHYLIEELSIVECNSMRILGTFMTSIILSRDETCLILDVGSERFQEQLRLLGKVRIVLFNGEEKQVTSVTFQTSSNAEVHKLICKIIGKDVLIVTREMPCKCTLHRGLLAAETWRQENNRSVLKNIEIDFWNLRVEDVGMKSGPVALIAAKDKCSKSVGVAHQVSATPTDVADLLDSLLASTADNVYFNNIDDLDKWLGGIDDNKHSGVAAIGACGVTSAESKVKNSSCPEVLPSCSRDVNTVSRKALQSSEHPLVGLGACRKPTGLAFHVLRSNHQPAPLIRQKIVSMSTAGSMSGEDGKERKVRFDVNMDISSSSGDSSMTLDTSFNSTSTSGMSTSGDSSMVVDTSFTSASSMDVSQNESSSGMESNKESVGVAATNVYSTEKLSAMEVSDSRTESSMDISYDSDEPLDLSLKRAS